MELAFLTNSLPTAALGLFHSYLSPVSWGGHLALGAVGRVQQPRHSWGWLWREGAGLAEPGCFLNLGSLWREHICHRRPHGRAASQGWSLTQSHHSLEIHQTNVFPITSNILKNLLGPTAWSSSTMDNGKAKEILSFSKLRVVASGSPVIVLTRLLPQVLGTLGPRNRTNTSLR